MMADYSQVQSEVVLTAQRSRGPGGQHVNKTNSAAELRWNYQNSYVLNEEQKRLVGLKLSSFINKENELLLRSDTFRDLESNKKEVLKKLMQLLARAFKKEKPRVATPTYGSKQRRHSEKKKRSEIKKGRTGKWD